MSITKAVIPAAGLGTRLRPVTHVVAKELFPVLDKPLIQLVVEEAVAAGIEEIVIVINEQKKAIQTYFETGYSKQNSDNQSLDILSAIVQNTDIRFVEQPQPLGLGHAVLMAEELIGDSPFAVLLGDNLTQAPKPVLRQLIDVHQSHQGAVIGVEQVSVHQISQYGIVEPEWQKENVYKIKQLFEKPAEGTTDSNLAIVGRYVLPREIFDCLRHSENGKNRELQLTDAIAKLLDTQSVFACQFKGQRLDLGSSADFIHANILAALERPDLRADITRLLSEIQTARISSENKDDEK